MVTANTLLESLATTCRRSDAVPSDVTYATVELDAEGEHSDVSLPVVEFYITDIDRNRNRNTEVVGRELDDTGAEIGYVYEQWFDAYVSVDISTVPQTQLTHRELDQRVRRALYRHDTHGPGEPLPKPNSTGVLGDVAWIHTDEISRANDFGMSPSVRGRQIDLEIGFTHQLTSSDLGIEYETVENVSIPTGYVLGDDNAVESAETTQYS